MPESTTLSSGHKALVTELCDELALTADQKATVMTTLEHSYRLGSGPRPEFPETEYQRLRGDPKAQRHMLSEHKRSVAPLAVRALLDMATAAGVSKTNRQRVRATIKRQIKKLVGKR